MVLVLVSVVVCVSSRFMLPFSTSTECSIVGRHSLLSCVTTLSVCAAHPPLTREHTTVIAFRWETFMITCVGGVCY